jgi:hypothetical protein
MGNTSPNPAQPILEGVTLQPVATDAAAIAGLERPVAVEHDQTADAVDLWLDREALRVSDRGLEGEEAIVGDQLGQDVGDRGHVRIVLGMIHARRYEP